MIEKGLLPEKNNEIKSRLAQIESEALSLQNIEAERLRQLQNNDARKQQIIDFCNQIADNQKGLEEIKISILNGIFTLDDMAQNFQNSRLSPDLFKKIGYYISGKKQVEFYLWKDLPPLLSDRTDIYFFDAPTNLMWFEKALP